MTKFQDLLPIPTLLRALEEQSITTPTPIQEQVLPHALHGADIVAQAPTGTGKTLAFVLPAIAAIDTANKQVQAVILCPTRELVIQICEVIQATCKYHEGIRVAGLYGGQNLQRQLLFMRKKPQIVVATPGRMLDHLARRTVRLQDVKYFVLDECDVMLDMGFLPDVTKIMGHLPDGVQKSIYSATLPQAIRTLADGMMHDPVSVQATCAGGNIPDIRQYFCMIKDSQRIGAVLSLLERYDLQRVTVFANTKARAEKIGQALISAGRIAEVLHGDLKQALRTRIMQGFKQGKTPILVATDVAARGIDVQDVDAVINVDPPTETDFYLHRIGRTARADKGGMAFTLLDAGQTRSLAAYQNATHQALQPLTLETIAHAYTLPHDGSNRLRTQESDSERFFLNVGKRDGLDKEGLAKLLREKAQIELWQIVDIKVRDTYGFVEVAGNVAENVWKLRGLMLGTRKLNVQEAKEDEPSEPKGNPARKRSASKPTGAKPARRGEQKPTRRADDTKDAPKRKRDGKVRLANGKPVNPKPRPKRIKKL